MFGKCFLITAYCDNPEKISVLSDCIDNIRRISDFDIIIYSHYPLTEDIQHKANMSIFDKSNPVLKYPEKSYIFWKRFSNYKIYMNCDDYGWAAMSQWKNGYNYLRNLRYEQIIILNYDVFIDNILFDNIIYELKFYDGILFYWKDKDDMINMSICALNKTDIFDNVSLDDYLQKSNIIIEDYLGGVIRNSNYSFKKLQHSEYREHFYTTMDIQSKKRFKNDDLPNSLISEPFVFFHHPYDENNLESFVCRVHIGAKVQNDNKKNLCIILYDVVAFPIKLEVFINDNLYFSSSTISQRVFFLETNFLYDDFVMNELKVELRINDIEFLNIDKLKANCRIELL